MVGASKESCGTLETMSWLVVGGGGQLGRAISLVLSERDIDYQAWGSKELDIRDDALCLERIGELVPAVVINAAAWTDVDGAESDFRGANLVNAFGSRNLAVAAKATGAIFTHISTDYVFSGVSAIPWQEDELQSAVSVYGKTKAAGEQGVLDAYAEHSYIFRTAWLYSRWGKNFAKTMTRLALTGADEVKVVGDQIGQPTFAIDLANQIVDSVLAELPFGIYHGTNSGEASWFDFACEIFQLSDAEVTRVVTADSSSFIRPAKRPAYSVLGHEGWSRLGKDGEIVPEMRDWKIALREAMPAILTEVRADGGTIGN